MGVSVRFVSRVVVVGRVCLCDVMKVMWIFCGNGLFCWWVGYGFGLVGIVLCCGCSVGKMGVGDVLVIVEVGWVWSCYGI